MKNASALEVLLIVGATVAFILFTLTSQGGQVLPTTTRAICGQGERDRQDDGGFDPLTGVPRGYSSGCYGPGGSVNYYVYQPATGELAARRAIPLPEGFLLGAAAAGAVLLVDRRRKRSRLTASRDIREP